MVRKNRYLFWDMLIFDKKNRTVNLFSGLFGLGIGSWELGAER